MGVELDLGKYLGIQADLLAVEQGHLLADHPSSFRRWMRRQQGDWESPMRSAISAVESEDSSCSNARIR